jgi:hypothetical protein
VTISGAYAGVTKAANLGVVTTPDTVTIQTADYLTSKRQLSVSAKSSSSTSVLRVYVSSTAELIGTLSATVRIAASSAGRRTLKRSRFVPVDPRART